MQQQPEQRSGVLGLVVLLGLVLLLATPAIIYEVALAPDGYFAHTRMQGALADQQRYHLPVIQTFSEQLPSPDLVHYASATAPGYHLAMGVIYRITGGSVFALRALNLLIGIALVLVVYRLARRFVPERDAFLLMVPLALSWYILSGSIWLTTDNLALLLVCVALGGASLIPWTNRFGITLGIAAACAVFVRQIHVWVAAPIGWSALLATPLAAFVPSALRGSPPPGRPSWVNLVIGVVCAAMPLVVLAALWLAWGGLVPANDEMRSKHAGGVNTSTFAVALSMVGLLGALFIPLAIDRTDLRLLRNWRLWASAAIGLVPALVFQTQWIKLYNDKGWFWKIVVRLPGEIEGRALAIGVLAPLGAMVIAVLLMRAAANERRREAATLSLGMLGWVFAQSLNSMAWQRYFEPLVLVYLIWMTALASRANRPTWAWLGIAALIVGQLAVSLTQTYMVVIKGGAIGP